MLRRSPITLYSVFTSSALIFTLKGFASRGVYPSFSKKSIQGQQKLSIEEYMERIERADPIDGREANVFLST